VILWLGLGIGLLTGLGLSKWRGHPYLPPTLNHIWLVFLGFLPQFLAVYLGRAHFTIPDWLAALSVVTSQLILLIFAWLNRRLPGMSILIVGLVLNMAVIVVNGGFMPINPNTAERLVGAERMTSFEIGSRMATKIFFCPQLEPDWNGWQIVFYLL
jgi:hypothetical protein